MGKIYQKIIKYEWKQSNEDIGDEIKNKLVGSWK